MEAAVVEDDAQADYDVVKELYAAGAIGNFDAAVIRKDDNGKVHVNKDETATRKGAWGGAAVGAVVGIIFPPSILASAGVGALAGGLGGHFLKGMSRKDVKELGEFLDEGDAAVGLQYDSADRRATLAGAYKAAPPVERGHSGQWRTGVFRLADARFCNRQNSFTDFRLTAGGTRLTVRRVTVRRE